MHNKLEKLNSSGNSEYFISLSLCVCNFIKERLERDFLSMKSSISSSSFSENKINILSKIHSELYVVIEKCKKKK